MGYYTKYSMEVEDIDNKGYDSYKIVKYMLDKNEESDKFYPFRNQLEELIECANEVLMKAMKLNGMKMKTK